MKFLDIISFVVVAAATLIGAEPQLRRNPWSTSERVNLNALNCVVSDVQKADCGWQGIVQSQCTGSGCCWSPSSTGAPWCFYPAPSPPTVHPTAAPSAQSTKAPTMKPTVSPTKGPSAKPTTPVPTAHPTAPVPTQKPTTAAPNRTPAPSSLSTVQPTNLQTQGATRSPSQDNSTVIATTDSATSTSNSPLSFGAMVGVIVAGIIVLGGLFVLYVFCNIYEKPVAKPIEQKPAPVEKVGIQLTPYSGVRTSSSHPYNPSRSTVRDDSSLYSLFSKANQSQITSYEVNRRDLEVLPASAETEDEESIEFEGITPGGPVRWYEGRDHGFVTP